MIEKSIQSKILNEFDAIRSTYQDYSLKVSELATSILAAASVTVHSVTSRCKDRPSLARKLLLPDKSYQSLDAITDISGIRITTYFSDDVDRVAALIEKEFEVIRDQSADKRITIDPDRFGYQSLHYIATLSPERSSLIEYQRFKGLKTEIQIRSILQHAWAEIEHDLGYKSASGVPRDVRRRFARVAGLLELADAEFDAIRIRLSEYAGSVVSEIQQDPAKVELDLLSLRALFTIDSHSRKLDKIVTDVMRRELNVDPEKVRENLVPSFENVGITHIDEIEAAAKHEQHNVSEFARYWLSRPSSWGTDDDSAIDSGIGLFYLLYVLIWRSQSQAVALHYLRSNNIGDENEYMSVAQDIMNFAPRS